MRFSFRPIDPNFEFFEQIEGPIKVPSDNYVLVPLQAKRPNTMISEIHVDPVDPSNSKVIVAAIVPQSGTLINLYLRNLDTRSDSNVMVSYLQSTL